MLFYFVFNWLLMRFNTFYYIYVLMSSFGKSSVHFLIIFFLTSSLHILNLRPLSVIHETRIFSTLWFAFLLINGDKLFFFWWREVANFQGVKFIDLFLYVRALCGLVKIFPYIRTWRCVSKLSSKAEERINFWVIIFLLPNTWLFRQWAWD